MPARAASIGRMDREEPKPRNSSLDPYMGIVDTITEGCAGFGGRLSVKPPRIGITNSGSLA